jgi:hypothetical protein
MGMAALRSSVRLLERGHFEESAIGPLLIGHSRFRIAVPAPEEVARIRLRPGWKSVQGLHDFGRQHDVDRNSGLGLIEEELVAFEARLLEGYRIPDAQTAPAHQFGQRADAGAALLDVVGAGAPSSSRPHASRMTAYSAFGK